MRERVLRARQAVGAQHALHPGLVTEVPAGLLAHALDSELIAEHTERNLEFLERPEKPIQLPSRPRDPLDRRE